MSEIPKWRGPASESERRTPEQRREQRIREIIERRHRTASAAFRLERILSEKDAMTTEVLNLIKKELGHLPKELQDVYDQCARKYFYQKDVVTKAEETFAPVLEDEFGNTKPETWGLKMFRQRTGKLPNGVVRWERREGYFIMSFAEHYDYVSALRGEEEKETRADESGATFHRAIPFHFFTYKALVPVLMVSGLREGDEKEYRRLVTHERQHFINHVVFEKFAITEKGEALPPDFAFEEEVRKQEKRYQAIKDEVVAYVRDGTNGAELKEFLSGKLYNHLFENFREEDKVLAYDLVGRVSDALSRVEDIFDTHEKRAILAYHLVDIPLRKMPQWVDEIGKFYREYPP